METSRIAAFDVFAELPAAELEALGEVMTEVEFEEGATIITSGDFGYVLYLIEAGEAEVELDDGSFGPVLGPGDTFGEIALLVTGRRTATVVARSPMRVLSLFDQDFHRLRGRAPELDRFLRRLGGDRLG
jgi:CRP-like cAMP-binding protein